MAFADFGTIPVVLLETNAGLCMKKHHSADSKDNVEQCPTVNIIMKKWTKRSIFQDTEGTKPAGGRKDLTNIFFIFAKG